MKAYKQSDMYKLIVKSEHPGRLERDRYGDGMDG